MGIMKMRAPRAILGLAWHAAGLMWAVRNLPPSGLRKSRHT